MDTSGKPPFAFIIAILAAGSLMPFAMLLDATTASGGDGYQNFGSMLLFLAVAAVVTLGGIIAGLKSKERHSWMALLALVLWVLPLMVMI